MLIIKDHAALQRLVALAKEQDRFEPPGASSSTGYLAPALAYLDDLGGGSDEFKFTCRVILTAGSTSHELRFDLEVAQPDGRWTHQTSGVLRAEPGPPLAFRLHFLTNAPSSAA